MSTYVDKGERDPVTFRVSQINPGKYITTYDF